MWWKSITPLHLKCGHEKPSVTLSPAKNSVRSLECTKGGEDEGVDMGLTRRSEALPFGSTLFHHTGPVK